MSTALVRAVPGADNGDMVLLVMLPTDDQVMMIQTAHGKTIAELEEYIVAEYARVFPKKAALPHNMRIQKCVPMSLVLNRRKRSHDQFQGKQQQNKDQHCFVELSKTVQVGNVFEAMEQIYVVTNTGKETSSPQIQSQPNKPLAIANGTEQPADGKKKKKKNKNEAANGVVDKPTQQQQQPKGTTQQKNTEQAKKQDQPKKQEQLKNPEQPKKQEEPKKQEQPKKQAQVKKQEQAKKQEQKKAPSVPVVKPTATPVVAPQVTAIPEVQVTEVATPGATKEPEVPVKAKRGRKAKVAVDTPVMAVTQPEPAAPATSEPPAKKAKVAAPAKETRALVEETSTETPMAAAVETIEAPVKAKRGRKPAAQALVEPTPVTSEAPAKGRKKKQPATTVDADQAPPAAKRAKTAAASKATEAEAADDKPAPKRLGRPPKVKETAAPVEAAAVAEPASSKPVRLSIQETIASLRERIAAEKAAKESKSTEEAAPANDASTKNAATAAETAVKAKTTKDASATKAAKEPKATKANKVAKEAAVATEATSSAAQDKSAAKRSFSDILAQTRARLSAEKLKQNVIEEDGSDDETTDSSVVASSKPAKAANMAAPVQIETHDSATSSDSDFEDKPKQTTPKKATPTKKPSPKATSDDSTDDEELDYSQSLLADLTKSDPVTPQKTVPQSTVSTPTEQPPRMRGRPRKTKVVLPTDDADIAPESSQETATDLSQDLLSQKNPESNSVLVSSLSKNRFSLDNIPVAKLKKTSKNPFATTTNGKDAAPAPAKRGPGRPRKIKE